METESIYIERTSIAEPLVEILRASDAGALKVVWLLGELGQGKTTFLKHYIEEQNESRLTAYAACTSPLGTETTAALRPHQPLKDVIEDFLTSQRNVRRYKNLVRNISLTVLACIPVVGEIAYGIKEIRRDLTEFKSGKREVELDKFEEEYIFTLKQLSVNSPLLIVIDDVQWMDRQSMQVLQRFFLDEDVAQRSITLVLAGRFDEMQRKEEILDVFNKSVASGATELRVPPFRGSQIREYFQLRFPAVHPEEDLLQWLEQKTGGNPFFLSSYIRHLLLEGILAEDGSQRSDVTAFKGMPAEIRLVTRWLLKSLTEEELMLVLTASVLGYEFSVHELTYLTQKPVLELIRTLRKMKALYGICEPVGYKLINGKESTVYRFSQHAIHTALYNELSVEEKETLHRAVARYLHGLQKEVRDDPDMLNSIASALAMHAQLGKDSELEYESLLLKARNTSERIDDLYVQERITDLAGRLGKPEDQLRYSYSAAAGLAPVQTHISGGGYIPDMDAEDPEARALREPLSGLAFTALGYLRDGAAGNARSLLDARIAASQKLDIEMHPLLFVLHALTAYQEGNVGHSQRRQLEGIIERESGNIYAALAGLLLAVFTPEYEEEELIAHLTESAAYRGEYASLVRKVILTIVRTRFSGNPSIMQILQKSPLFQDVPLS